MHIYLKRLNIFHYKKLVIASLVVGFLAALLGISLKHVTEHYENILYTRALANSLWFVIFPAFGLSLIYILRQYLFKKKENKGIKEVFDATAKNSNGLPSYKIPSHFINGMLTVIFGGSTGVEVSTVVATAAVGSLASEKETFLKRYKTELICAGIAAGVTALFNTPLAGLLFAYEVVSKKTTKPQLISTLLAAGIAYAFVLVLNEEPLFAVHITQWHLHALPWFIVLGILAGINSVYLTKCVLFFKKQFLKFNSHYYKILFGAAAISLMILVLPQLYGEGYHAIKESIAGANTLKLTPLVAITLCGILLLKPIITSVTLGAGGDGGVFAPGIFIGAFLGLFFAVILNTFFNAEVIPLNFMIVGMAAMLSASIHAPFTALFLVCGLVNDYTLFIPLLIVSLVAKYTAQSIFPYTVYSFAKK
ncbi:chloride channel protein [Flavobacterium rivuli WB 3.3-2 = DSM 21788]|uniref:Chloride channel protein n=1 Tax=Flavobacterium rivuli WB 3.3-2 = DSM 21788 TaxID=1121895 RepID=A0A0A2M4U5_9FLAO|nr:chloride channel protein [Flavobacterium rivuli]KGO86621.1 chloride channel protein [Flavobacterium rivuli WB 3.3-2 = DSM 21788]